MDSSAVEQAKRHLSRAERALQQLLNATGITETRSAWTDFLTAVSAIYEILKVGSRSLGSSAGWFGRVVKERRDDELLRYLHHARNSDFHGLKEVTGDTGSRSERQMPDGTFSGYISSHPEGIEMTEFHSFTINPDGTKTEIFTPLITTSFATLIPVYDEIHKDTCEVPTKHWGQSRLFLEPRNAAEAAIPYLQGLLAIAEAMSMKKPR